jgi:hypothetical protein
MQTISSPSWRTSFIARHRRVLKGYRDVLDNGSIPPAERDAIIERMRRVAQEIRDAEGLSTNTAVAA